MFFNVFSSKEGDCKCKDNSDMTCYIVSGTIYCYREKYIK